MISGLKVIFLSWKQTLKLKYVKKKNMGSNDPHKYKFYVQSKYEINLLHIENS